MTPTMTRMAYLTLRGVCVARLLEGVRPSPPRIVEVHPGAALVLRDAPVDDVREMKRSPAARERLLAWLEGRGLRGASRGREATDHVVAACAAALAAWDWVSDRSAWLRRARPPLHPYDFAC